MIQTLTKRAGELCLSALFVSGLSGFILAFQYDPSTPFVSTVLIDALLPFGRFLRSLHFWSSQSFFLLLIWHAYKNIPETDRIGKTSKGILYWMVLTSTLFFGVYALFSGYILRFDQTGQDAARIAEHLFLTIPVIGNAIDRFLLALADEGVNRVYVVHIFFTFVLWLLGTWYHLGRTILRADILFITFSLTILFSSLVPAPLDPKDITMDLVKGPWFFLGIQELLRYLPPFWAGVVFPSISIISFGALCIQRAKKVAAFILISWLISYILLTVIAILR